MPEGWPDPPAHVSWVTKANGFLLCTGLLGMLVLDVSTLQLVNGPAKSLRLMVIS